jgi:hypothetical protein
LNLVSLTRESIADRSIPKFAGFQAWQEAGKYWGETLVAPEPLVVTAVGTADLPQIQITSPAESVPGFSDSVLPLIFAFAWLP